jgi:hypothetical protein
VPPVVTHAQPKRTGQGDKARLRFLPQQVQNVHSRLSTIRFGPPAQSDTAETVRAQAGSVSPPPPGTGSGPISGEGPLGREVSEASEDGGGGPRGVTFRDASDLFRSDSEVVVVNSALYEACKAGEVGAVRALLAGEGAADVNGLNEGGATPLHAAALLGNDEVNQPPSPDQGRHPCQCGTRDRPMGCPAAPNSRRRKGAQRYSAATQEQRLYARAPLPEDPIPRAPVMTPEYRYRWWSCFLTRGRTRGGWMSGSGRRTTSVRTSPRGTPFEGIGPRSRRGEAFPVRAHDDDVPYAMLGRGAWTTILPASCNPPCAKWLILPVFGWHVTCIQVGLGGCGCAGGADERDGEEEERQAAGQEEEGQGTQEGSGAHRRRGAHRYVRGPGAHHRQSAPHPGIVDSAIRAQLLYVAPSHLMCIISGDRQNGGVTDAGVAQGGGAEEEEDDGGEDDKSRLRCDSCQMPVKTVSAGPPSPLLSSRTIKKKEVVPLSGIYVGLTRSCHGQPGPGSDALCVLSRQLYTRLQFVYCSTACVQAHKRTLMAEAAMRRLGP